MRAYRTSVVAGIALMLWPTASTRVVPVTNDASNSAAPAIAEGASSRERSLFDFDWRFHAGEADGGQAPGTSDAGWDRVDLPHDFMIAGKGQNVVVPGARAGGGRNASLPTQPEGPFDPRSPGGSSNGYLNGGIGWYRKTFKLPASASARRVFLEFEGVYMNSEVWLNGEKLGTRPYGYSTFEYELTPHLKFGDAPNVIAVRVLVQQPSTRWYSGAGIYRHVWLTVTDPVHIDHWGTVVTTPDITGARAQVRVRVNVVNQAATPATTRRLVATIRDARGKTATVATESRSISANGSARFDLALTVPQPHRWSIADPYLYTVDSRVRVGGRDVDAVRVPFGIRTIAFTADSGFLLNGERVPLQGVCLHHDLGPLGRRRVRPRHRAAARDHEADGRERHPHEPQSPGAGAARRG